VTPSTVHDDDDDDDDEAAANGTSGADDDSAASAQQQPKSTIQSTITIKLKQQFKKLYQQHFILKKYIYLFLKALNVATKGHDDDRVSSPTYLSRRQLYCAKKRPKESRHRIELDSPARLGAYPPTTMSATDD
jgi:hypothetical protein